MQMKDDKVGKKTANKDWRKEKEKKRAREKDRNRFAKLSQNSGLCACVKTKKKLFNYALLVGKFAFFVAKLIFEHSYAN